MKNVSLNLTPQSLEVYKVISRIRMAWLTLCVMLVLFTVGFSVFLYAIFHVAEVLSKAILGGIDGVLGWSIKTIVGFLFSEQSTK